MQARGQWNGFRALKEKKINLRCYIQQKYIQWQKKDIIFRLKKKLREFIISTSTLKNARVLQLEGKLCLDENSKD